MPKAIWNGKVVAESDKCRTVEGNVYFPDDALDREFFLPSETTTYCHWKGIAHYHTLSVDGEENADAAWYYPNPLPAASNVRGYVAFWRGVTVED